MNELNKRDAVVKAVKKMKKGEFGLTALKVELEASLSRRDSENGDSYETCPDCNGNWEGFTQCDQCDGTGMILGDDCENCEGYGSIDCNFCDEGDVEHDSSEDQPHAWSSVGYCHNWLMEKLSHLGLAEYNEDEEQTLSHMGYESTNWYPVAPLMYAEFYNDGSVDSEFTFTIAMDNPENVFILPKVVEIYNEMAEAIGNGVNTSGAGMHMALLNSPDCVYPISSSSRDTVKFENFRKSMQLLMPSLYFLGSSNDKSRSLDYRRPEIGASTHRTAVDWRGGAVEFRVFETCYHNPEAILDNVVVMANAIKYWSSTYKPHGLSKVAPQGCRFGLGGSDALVRHYVTREHIDLLNGGLQILKPSYYTIREVKNQRKFNVTKTHINNKDKQVRREAIIEYKEYEQRFGWTKVMREHQYITNAIDQGLYCQEIKDQVTQQAIKEIEKQAQAHSKEFEKTKQSVSNYVEEKVAKFHAKTVGSYQLRADI